MKNTILATIAGAALCLGSCSVPDGWSVDGVLTGVQPGTRLALEKYGNGRWLLVDSLTVAENGDFGYDSKTAARYAEIMRITLPGAGSIYFPVDSVDDIVVEADSANFSHARIFGTPAVAAFQAVDSIVMSAPGVTENLQRSLIPYITADTTGIVAYYTVTKSIGRTPIFNPNESLGNRVYGAAAQTYATYKPNDPRGRALLQAYAAGRQALGRLPEPETSTVEIPETGFIDIERYDYSGRLCSLSSLATPGKTVLLSFTSYEVPSSPAYNAVLNELYTAYHNRGLEIYQLAFDQNEATWKEAARNLPWITVWNSPADGMTVAANYNVGVVPVTYIIRDGEIVSRVDDFEQLSTAVASAIR